MTRINRRTRERLVSLRRYLVLVRQDRHNRLGNDAKGVRGWMEALDGVLRSHRPKDEADPMDPSDL